MDSDGWEWRGYFRWGNFGRLFWENSIWDERGINIKDLVK